MREIRTRLVEALIALVSGSLIWWMSGSKTIAFCFVMAAIAVEILYQELRRIRQTLEVIAEKLGRSSLISW
jgi:hypothetical protein